MSCTNYKRDGKGKELLARNHRIDSLVPLSRIMINNYVKAAASFDGVVPSGRL